MKLKGLTKGPNTSSIGAVCKSSLNAPHHWLACTLVFLNPHMQLILPAKEHQCYKIPSPRQAWHNIICPMYPTMGRIWVFAFKEWSWRSSLLCARKLDTIVLPFCLTYLLLHRFTLCGTISIAILCERWSAWYLVKVSWKFVRCKNSTMQYETVDRAHQQERKLVKRSSSCNIDVTESRQDR